MSAPRGVKNQFHKLCELDVFVIRFLFQQGYSPYLLAKIFNISRPHAKRIGRMEKWSWMTDVQAG
jgi:hypothetical protein